VKSVFRTIGLAAALFVPTLLFARIARSAIRRLPVPDTALSRLRGGILMLIVRHVHLHRSWSNAYESASLQYQSLVTKIEATPPSLPLIMEVKIQRVDFRGSRSTIT